MAWVPTYLGELPGDTWSLPSCCNDDGSVIYGASSASGSVFDNVLNGPFHPVRWSSGSATAMGTLGSPTAGYGSAPQCCSPDGSLAGGYSVSSGTFFVTPTVWQADGASASALTLPANLGGDVGFCENTVSIDDGWFGNYSITGGYTRGFYYSSGSAIPLSPSAPLTNSLVAGCARGSTGIAIGDDNAGADPGQQAAIWDSGVQTLLGFLPDGNFSSVSSVDNAAQNVVGASTSTSASTGLDNVYWDSSNVIHSLGLNPGVALTGQQPSYITPNGQHTFVNYQDSMGQTWAAVLNNSHILTTLPGLCGVAGSQPTYQSYIGNPPTSFFYRPASDDGTRYVGFASDGTDTWGVIWINLVPFRLLPPTGLAPERVQPMGISADGSTVFGFIYSTGSGPFRAAKWTFDASVPEPNCPGLPNPPTGTCATPTVNSVTFSWSPDPDFDAPDSYTLQYRLHGTSSWTTVTGLTSTSYTLSPVAIDTSWDWQVEATYDSLSYTTAFSELVTCPTVTAPFATQFLSCGNGFTITAPITKMWGFDHLIGMSVVGLLDGILMPAQVVAADGSVTLPFAASNVKIGLPFTPQLQTPYLDAGQPTVQGRRKNISAVTARIEASLGVLAGANQPDGAAQQPPAIATTWGPLTPAQVQPVPSAVPVSPTYLSPAGQTVTKLVTGDMRTVVTADWQIPGQVAIQGTPGLPLNVLDCVPELLEGDTTEQTYAQREPREPRGGPGQPAARGPGMWMLRR